MKSLIIAFLLLSIGVTLQAQPPSPPRPADCQNTSGRATMKITGGTSFVLDDLPDFSSEDEPLSTIEIFVDCNKNYKVYVAGEIIQMPDSPPTNTIIPINTFSVLATLPGTGPIAPFPLAGPAAYQVLIQGTNTGGNGRTHNVSITRKALSTFTQAPGGHTLYLHFYLCQI